MRGELFLRVGAHVHFQDGKGGTLHKVAVDPHTKQVTDLIVLRGFLQRHDYVIPISAVESVTPQEIYLTLRIQDLANYSEYREVEFNQWSDEWDAERAYPREHVVVCLPQLGIYLREKKVVPVIRHRISKGIHAGEVVIGRTSVVRSLNEVLGKVDHLWLERENWEVTHLVVRRGLAPHYVIIPFSKVESITPKAVYIRDSGEPLKEVPISQWHLELIESFSTESDLYSLDESLAIAEELSDALAADPRTAASVIGVVYEHGVATLIGEVEYELAHRAAEVIAHRHERVVSVVNALEVCSQPKWADEVASTYGRLMGLIDNMKR